MNYYKPVHLESPEQRLTKSNRLFLRMIGLFILIAALGLTIDMLFYHSQDNRIFYRVSNAIYNNDKITADLDYIGRK
jgi:hypothetical protein